MRDATSKELQRTPNFFILGAAKSGTTAIAKVIGAHPEIFVPAEKEVQFFSSEEMYDQGMEFLYSRFEKGKATPIRCDASPQYLYNRQAIDRVRLVLGESAQDCKFLVVLRNPIQRAHSAYWMAVRYGWDNRTFDTAVKENIESVDAARYEPSGLFNIHSYVHAGKYFAQLLAWFGAFERRQFLVVRYEQFRREPEEFYETLRTFLGVAEGFRIPDQKRVNPASMPRSRALLQFTEKRHFLKDLLKPLLSQDLRFKLRYALRDANLKPIGYEPMSLWARDTLRAEYADDLASLETLLGWQLDDWRD